MDTMTGRYLSLLCCLCVLSLVATNENSNNTTIEETSTTPSVTIPREDIGDQTYPPMNTTDSLYDAGNITMATESTMPDYEYDANTTESPGNVTEVPTIAQSPLEETELIIGDFCLCDLKVGSCDVNCCCDDDCSPNDRKVFSGCQTRPADVLDARYCLQRTTIFRNHTECTEEYSRAGLTCIVTDNLPQRTTYTTVKGATTVEELEALERGRHPWQSWPLRHPQQELRMAPYVAGSPVLAYSSEHGLFSLGMPTSVIGSACEALEPLRFLEDGRSSCVRVVQSLPKECHSNPHLSALTFLSFAVVADPGALPQNSSSSEEDLATTTTTTELTTPQDTTEPPTSTPGDTEEVPAEAETPQRVIAHPVRSVRITALNATELELVPVKVHLCGDEDEDCGSEVASSDVPEPMYDMDMCRNIARQVEYVFIHNGTEGITEVQAKVYLGDIANGAHLTQGFNARYVWAAAVDSSGDSVFERSGRPGYVRGRPLLAGRLAENVTDDGELVAAVVVDTDPTQWLTLLAPGAAGQCTARTQVNFGVGVRSGCLIHLTRDDLLDCNSLRRQVLHLLLGSQLGDPGTLRVATYGDSSANRAGDWVPVLVPEEPRFTAATGLSGGPDKCFEVILSLHLEVVYSLQGALTNPQAKVVAVALRYGPPQTVTAQTVEVTSSVSFVDATLKPQPEYAEPPALDVKLPYDFFYPFLPSTGHVSCRGAGVVLWRVCAVFVAIFNPLLRH